jgi:hypothetical protein
VDTGATYRKREVEDEDEEAVHGAATAAATGADAGRRVEDHSHAQNGPAPESPAPAIPSRGATPPVPDDAGEVERRRASESACAQAGQRAHGWVSWS